MAGCDTAYGMDRTTITVYGPDGNMVSQNTVPRQYFGLRWVDEVPYWEHQEEGPSPIANAAQAMELTGRWQQHLAADLQRIERDYQEERRRLITPWITTDPVQHDWEADERAEALLMEHLDDKQRQSWEEGYCFEVIAASGRVYELGDGGLVTSEGRTYCIQPTERVPEADAVLARKLLLEADEDEFLRIANDITPGGMYFTPPGIGEGPYWIHTFGESLVPIMRSTAEQMVDLMSVFVNPPFDGEEDES